MSLRDVAGAEDDRIDARRREERGLGPEAKIDRCAGDRFADERREGREVSRRERVVLAREADRSVVTSARASVESPRGPRPVEGGARP